MTILLTYPVRAASDPRLLQRVSEQNSYFYEVELANIRCEAETQSRKTYQPEYGYLKLNPYADFNSQENKT
jgi:hypothetical protein